jgi:hypothetical protein
MVESQLSSAKDSEDFYKKLVELRNEQKQTLLFMEELYNQKQLLKEGLLKSEHSLKELTTHATLPSDYKYSLNTISAYETRPFSANLAPVEFENTTNESISLSSKPPIPQKITTNKVTFQDEKEENLMNALDENLMQIEKIWNDFKLESASSLSENSLKTFDFYRKFEKKMKKIKKDYKKSNVQYEWYELNSVNSKHIQCLIDL